jgi:hypothetical protein
MKNYFIKSILIKWPFDLMKISKHDFTRPSLAREFTKIPLCVHIYCSKINQMLAKAVACYVIFCRKGMNKINNLS